MADLKIQQLATVTTLADDAVFPVVTSPGTTPADGSVSVATVRKAMVKTASIAFTDGDSYRRVTITDSAVQTTSNLVCTIRRPNTADDSQDIGVVYIVNVCNVAAGSFDVNVACLGYGVDDIGNTGLVNETITLCYTIG